MKRILGLAGIVALASCIGGIGLLLAETPGTQAGAVMSDASKAAATKLVDNGVKFLLSRREADGGWNLGNGANKPAITAMVLKALLQSGGDTTKDPVIRQSFDLMLTYRQKDGGIYNPKEGQENYTSAVALMALAAAKDPQYKSAIDDLILYLKGLQIVPGSQSPDGQKIGQAHPWVGGVSYGKHGRPDLSNVGMWMDALHEAGVPGDDPAMQRALVFVTNSQNRSESNAQPWAKLGPNDGGFVYAPAVKDDVAKGQSMAEEGPDGGLRSYGSMTYTGFKSLLYASVDPKDGRVQAALKWIQQYWRLDSNPNMPALRSKEGLYYYYHVFAKALRTWDQATIADSKGQQHNWREELTDALQQQVGPDGSWSNSAERWFEKNAVLSTCYAVLALEEVLK